MTTAIRYGSGDHPEWKRQARGPGGRGLCRRCLAEVPKGRRTFCSDQCVTDFQVARGQYRLPVFMRDNGVCAGCGLDTAKLSRLHKHWRRLIQDEPGGAWGDGSIVPRLDMKGRASCNADIQHWWELMSALGFAPRSPCYSLWDADHIVPLAEGGSNTMENLRTLCKICHKRETAALRRRMAERKKQTKKEIHHVI